MSFAIINIQSLRRHIGPDNLQRYIRENNPTLQTLTESFLNDEASNIQSLEDAYTLIDSEANPLRQKDIDNLLHIESLCNLKARNAITVACKEQQLDALLELDLPVENLVMVLFLEHRAAFERALILHSMEYIENWRLFKASKTSPLNKNRKTSLLGFEHYLQQYLQSLFLPGILTINPIFSLDRIILDIQYSGNQENLPSYDSSGQLELVPYRKPYSIVMDYHIKTGVMRIKTPNQSKEMEKILKNSFAVHFLKSPQGLLKPIEENIINLSDLFRASFPTSPIDCIAGIRVTHIEFVPPTNGKERVRITFPGEEIWECVLNKGLQPSELQLLKVKIQFRFEGKSMGRSRTVTLNALTNRITWGHNKRDQLIESYLIKWGLLHV